MKKTNIVAFVAGMVAMVLASCEQPKIEVTVIKKAEKNLAEKMMGEGFRPYKAITPSGDTVDVLIDESIELKKPLPYKAVMTKPVETRYGFIHPENQKAGF